MGKIYTFLIIVPVIALLIFKAVAFYEFDTKQRYIKNLVDSAAHKVMITGVMTAADKEQLLKQLQEFSGFKDEDIQLKYGMLQSDGSLADMDPYTPGNIMARGETFCIYVQSREECTISRMEGKMQDEDDRLYFKAKAVCRIEKCRQEE